MVCGAVLLVSLVTRLIRIVNLEFFVGQVLEIKKNYIRPFILRICSENYENNIFSILKS